MDHPRPSAHYPRSVGEFQAWFRSDEDCLDYLEWLRWPTGFACLVCGHHGAWRLGDGRLMCSGCGNRNSVTAGTIFDRTRTPLTVWFNACWLFASGKDGISALSLKRTLEIGSYQTAWAMLHRLRAVLVRPGRNRLGGMVQVDETYIGGVEPGLGGGRAPGKKVLTGIGVEVREPKGMGRCRIAPLADASAASLHRFVTDHVEPGATVVTDGWQGYSGLEKLGYSHVRRSQRAARFRGEDPGKLLPAAHQVASLVKRWLLGTIRAPRTTRTWPATSTSSCSASIVGVPVAGGWSSFGCSNSPSPTTRCATRTSSSAIDLGESRQHRRVCAGARRAWRGLQPTGRGEQRRRATPVKWIPQIKPYHRVLPVLILQSRPDHS